jgi:hypothetical protein
MHRTRSRLVEVVGDMADGGLRVLAVTFVVDLPAMSLNGE